MEFKERLVYLRKDIFKLTQEEFAKKIGYTRSAVSAWEIGRNEPSNDDIVKLADFFGVSTDYLLGKSDIRNPEKIDANEMDIAFATGIKGLNEENKEIAKNIIEGLLAKQENEKKDDKKETKEEKNNARKHI
ncbi:MAG: helix-turn-helix transcriptional regulator [Clostridia bacterium]|nr:helix-turn-helix transcriptional regulator [Clostridia bacterium]